MSERSRSLRTAGADWSGGVLPPNLRRALARTPQTPLRSLDEIEHVVILMQENRSFDHYFGTMAGVRGFDDPDALTLPSGRSVFYQPDSGHPDGYLLPFHLNTLATSAQAVPSTSHAWTTQHEAVHGGAMDQWVSAHRSADGADEGPYTMGYYTREDIPFHFALAEAFTLCDRYHASLLGPTWPNRLYLWSGTVDPGGQHGGPVTTNSVPSPYSWTTYPERLTAAGVSWHVYQQEDDYACNQLELFQQYQDAGPQSSLYRHGLAIGPEDQFERDVACNQLPTVSWIVPIPFQCEHPDYLPAAGADFVARKLDAIAANPEVWQRTVVLLPYDENDGLFDHVPPPLPPAGTPGEFVNGQPIGGGVRVPCTVVSPWSHGGHVADEPFDHTSILQFLEQITGVEEPNITTWRRRTFGNLTATLGYAGPLRVPQVLTTKQLLARAEYEVTHFPAPPIPEADQTPPHQHGDGGQQWDSGAAPETAPAPPDRRLRSDESSRLTDTTHAADFPHGYPDSLFPGILESARTWQAPRSTSRRHDATAPEYAYVPTLMGYSIAVLDTNNGTMVTAIPAGTNPYGITASPAGDRLYVTNSGSNDVSVIDPDTHTMSSSIVVGLYPHGIAAAPDGDCVYVANTGPDTGPGGSRSLSVIDPSTNQVRATVPVGTAPQSVTVTPDSSTVYVTCQDAVWALHAGGVEPRPVLENHGRAHGLALSPHGHELYIANSESHTVSVIDTHEHQQLATIPLGPLPWNIALHPDGTTAYVTNANADTVSVLETDTHTVTDTIMVDHIPTGIAATSDTVWVANNTSSTITGISTHTHTITTTVDLGLGTEPAEITTA